ncbi:MAG: SdpI family protein [Xanthomonadaceae bacterium]|nr:SdpI family protein [Xanthomonadaceae bacterium]MDE3073059.1 SdpI family protein [Pseudomonadota bacterium]
MRTSRSWMVSLAFFLVAVAVAMWLYPRLPARVAVHWDIHGRVDNYMPRLWSASFPALMILALAGLTWILPAISPRRFEIRPFAQVYALLMLATQGLVLVLGMATLLAAAGYAIPMPALGALGAGALYMILGNYMGKLRKNFFVGIRSPWTLASDAVWERTHRVAGWLFMLAGLLVVVLTLAGGPLWLTLALLVAAGLIPYGYSLAVYKRLQRDE